MGMWTPERVEVLKIMWGQGISASRISRALGNGISRNAVLGKAYRIGLPLRTRPKKDTKPKAVPKTPRKYTEKREWAHSKPMQMPDHVCRYGWCMEKGKGYPPYCDAHAPPEKPKTTIPWPVPLKRLTGGRA